MLNIYLTYCKIRNYIKYLINQIYTFLYCYIFIFVFYPWFRAYFISIWNKYLDHPVYKYRQKELGRQLAKEWFYNDPADLYNDYKSRVWKDKKLLIKILTIPYSIQPTENLDDNNIITAKNLWRN